MNSVDISTCFGIKNHRVRPSLAQSKPETFSKCGVKNAGNVQFTKFLKICLSKQYLMDILVSSSNI